MLVTDKSSLNPLPSIPQLPRDKVKLKNLKHTLRESMVKWMKKIAESNQEAREKYVKDPSFTRKNIWNSTDLLRACQVCKQPKMTKFIRDNSFQLLGYLDPQYFDCLKQKTKLIEGVKLKYRPHSFIAKSTVLASDAINAVIASKNRPSIIDCAMAVQMVRYKTLSVVLGEIFDRIFSSAHGQLMNLNYPYEDDSQPMKYFVRPTKATVRFVKELCSKQSNKREVGQMGNRPIKKGQVGAIRNVRDYLNKYPFGRYQNVNFVCSDATPGKQKFIGLDLNADGETESEIYKKLLSEYNKIEDRFFLDPRKEMTKWEEMSPAQIKEFKIAFSKKFPPATEIEGFNSGIIDFNVELIYDLLELPLEEVSMDVVKKLAQKYKIQEELIQNLDDFAKKQSM